MANKNFHVTCLTSVEAKVYLSFIYLVFIRAIIEGYITTNSIYKKIEFYILGI